MNFKFRIIKDLSFDFSHIIICFRFSVTAMILCLKFISNQNLEATLSQIALEFVIQREMKPELTEDRRLHAICHHVLVPQRIVHLLMENHQMSEEKAEKTFQEYRAPDDQKEENFQMAQAPTVETTEEDDIPDSIDDCDSDKENTIAKNTGEGFEPMTSG